MKIFKTARDFLGWAGGKKNLGRFALIIFFFLFAPRSFAENFLEIRIPCKFGENVSVILPSGEKITLGRVLMTPEKANYPAYTASKWSKPGTICASSVNALHILLDVENSRGKIISIVPSITIAPAAGRASFFAVNIPAGTGIFGGFAPLVGSRVNVLHDGKEQKISDIPKENDTLIIYSPLPEKPDYYMMDIENRPAGRVIAYGSNGVKIIARVIRPVGGVGRFGGGVFQNLGRIRASHAGVIDVSTSKRGDVGGFQIMPLKHALTSTEMINAWKLTQWMIISPLPNERDLEGKPPLFKNSFVPGAQLSDKLPDIFSQYGRTPLILCRIDGGNWERLPEKIGRIDDALKNITHFRLYFPVWNLL